MKNFVLILLLIFAMSVGKANANEKDQRFGQCIVQTDSDDFTDAKSVNLGCRGKGPSFSDYAVMVTCRPKSKYTIFLHAGIQIYLKQWIDVVYRFDKGPVRKRPWYWAGKTAIDIDKSVFDEFLKGISQSKRFVFKVGDNKGIIELDGSARAAKEFVKRCKKSVK